MMSNLVLPTLSGLHLKRAGLVGAAALALILAAGGATRLFAARAVTPETETMATPSVTVISLQRGQAADVSLPGRLEAWNAAPVYARTNGYIRAWHVDIGTRVRQGQLLAEIDAPELVQQLAGAEAALGVAEARLELATTTSERWQRLLEAGTVSRQAAEERAGDLATARAERNQAAAEVRRLLVMVGFTRITAPFDGMVTDRTAEVGALVSSSDAGATPLFTIAQERRLRLYVNVPENRAASWPAGSVAKFTVSDQPGREFDATVVSAAGAVDPRTGTMTLQLAVDNSGGMLRPGAYARVVLPTDASGEPELRIPASALLFRQEGPAVAVLREDGLVALRPIVIGRDDGRTLTVVSGLNGSERVIDNPSSAITAGQRVRVVDQPRLQ